MWMSRMDSDVNEDVVLSLSRNKLGLSVIICCLLVLFLNYPTVQSIIPEWNSNGPYSHGFLGVLVVIYSVWWQRHLLLQTHLQPAWLGALALLLSMTLLIIGDLTNIQQLQQMSLLLVMITVIWALAGIRVLQILVLPLLMLALILPFWSLLQGPLRMLSTFASYWGAKVFVTDLKLDGYHLITQVGVFSVEPSCSGLGFFLVAALLAICVSLFNRLNVRKSVQLVIIALMVSVVANWLRIIIIVVVGAQTKMQHSIVQDHLTFGWLVFAACLLPLLMIIHRYFTSMSLPSALKWLLMLVRFQVNRLSAQLCWPLLLRYCA